MSKRTVEIFQLPGSAEWYYRLSDQRESIRVLPKSSGLYAAEAKGVAVQAFTGHLSVNVVDPSGYCEPRDRGQLGTSTLDKILEANETASKHPRVAELTSLIRTREQLIRDCVAERDWHGVMDAAADIREFESELKGILHVFGGDA